MDDCAITGHTVADLGIGDDLYKVNFSTVQFLPDTISCICCADMRVVILSYGNGGVNICTVTASPADSSKVILTLCIGLNVVWHTWGYRKNVLIQMWYICKKLFSLEVYSFGSLAFHNSHYECWVLPVVKCAGVLGMLSQTSFSPSVVKV